MLKHEELIYIRKALVNMATLLESMDANFRNYFEMELLESKCHTDCHSQGYIPNVEPDYLWPLDDTE